jgi:hypothetical protein
MTLALFSLFLISGCGDKSTGPAGVSLNENAGALDAHPGTNASVKDSVTALEVGQIVQMQSMTAVSKVMEKAGGGMGKIKSASMSGNIDGSINGTKSGTATVKGSYSYTQSTGKLHYEALCTFSNYSDSGDIYIGGQMHFLMDGTFTQTSDDMSMTCSMTGKIKFNGDYVGSNTFSLQFEFSGTQQTGTYTSTIVSDGKTTTISVNLADLSNSSLFKK